MNARVGLVLTLVATAVAAFVAIPALAASLTISPSTGVAGSSATVTGAGFTGGSEVLVCWGSASASCGSLGAAGASDDGSFSITVTIPGDASPGDWTVSACGLDPETPGSCALTASTFFGVVAPATTTTTTTTTSTTTTSTTTTTTTPVTSTAPPPTTTTSTTAAPPPPPPPPAPPVTTAVAPSEAAPPVSTTIVAGGLPRANARGSGSTTTTSATSPGPADASSDASVEAAAPATGVAGAIAQIEDSGLNLFNPATFWGLWLMAVAAIAVVGGALWWVIAKIANRNA